MGTNYYWHEKPACSACGHEADPLHIGKSSAGWCFSLRVHPELGINDLPDWQERFAREGSFIRNEYGEMITHREMLEQITERARETPIGMTPWELGQNDAENGPGNLLRHRLGRGCVKHGAGMWDCIDREFC